MISLRRTIIVVENNGRVTLLNKTVMEAWIRFTCEQAWEREARPRRTLQDLRWNDVLSDMEYSATSPSFVGLRTPMCSTAHDLL